MPRETPTEKLTHSQNPDIVIYPGFGVGAKVFYDVCKCFANHGLSAVTVDAVHGIPVNPISTTPDNQKLTIPEIIYRKAAALVQQLESYPEPTTVIAVSATTAAAVVAAAQHPELFKQLILITPANIYHHESLYKLIVRFSTEAIVETLESILNRSKRNRLLTGYTDIVKNCLNPSELGWSMAEILAITQYNITEQITQLTHANRLNISLIGMDYDLLFPIELLLNKTQQTSGALKEQLGLTSLAVLNSGLGHNDFYLQPEKIVPHIIPLLISRETTRANH